MSEPTNRRILLIDDTPSIHEDFRKILTPARAAAPELDAALAGLLGAPGNANKNPAPALPAFELDFAAQGRDGLERMRMAAEAGTPFALAFVDVRMPPGWDGIRTIEELWKIDPALQAVICTAYSDHSWDEVVARLGVTDRLLILKKPFDAVEICQLAISLTEKWNVTRRERGLLEQLQRAEREARAYASSLETVNRALMTAKSAADTVTRFKADLLFHLSEEVHSGVHRVLGHLPQQWVQGMEDESCFAGVDTIVTVSQRLLRVFDAAMDLAAIDSGRLSCERAPTELRPILEDVCAEHRGSAVAKGLSLELEFLSEVPHSVITDGRRLHETLSQLVDHAIERSERGTVRLSVGIEWGSDWQDAMLRIEISDEGPPLPEEIRGRVFDPFARPSGPGDAGLTRLGVVVAKKLAEVLGGAVECEMGRGSGAVFSLVLETGSLAGVPMVRP